MDTINPAGDPMCEKRTWCPKCRTTRFGSSQILIIDLPGAKGRFCMICLYQIVAALATPLEERPA